MISHFFIKVNENFCKSLSTALSLPETCAFGVKYVPILRCCVNIVFTGVTKTPLSYNRKGTLPSKTQKRSFRVLKRVGAS